MQEAFYNRIDEIIIRAQGIHESRVLQQIQRNRAKSEQDPQGAFFSIDIKQVFETWYTNTQLFVSCMCFIDFLTCGRAKNLLTHVRGAKKKSAQYVDCKVNVCNGGFDFRKKVFANSSDVFVAWKLSRGPDSYIEIQNQNRGPQKDGQNDVEAPAT